MMKLMFSINCKNHLIVKEIFHHGTLWLRYTTTFHHRVLNYFEDKLKTHKNLKGELKSMRLVEKNFENIEVTEVDCETTKQKLKQIYEKLAELKNVIDLHISEEELYDLDVECFSLLNYMSTAEILQLLNSMLKFRQFDYEKSFFYDRAITLLIKEATNQSLNNHELVQLLFFISLKRDKINYVNYLVPILPPIRELPLFEKCVTANVFYKSSIKLPSSESKHLEEVIEKDFDKLITDSQLLIPLCKAVINSRPSNNLTLKNLSKAIEDLNKPLDFKTTAYILALYAEALLLEPKAIDILVKKCIKLLEEDNKATEHKLNLKNVDTFLWSLSTLGLILSLNEKMIIRNYVEKRFEEYKRNENKAILVNTILCLHLLRCWSTKIIKICLQERLFNPLSRDNVNWKIKSRLQLLITQITLEMNMYVRNKKLHQKIKIGFTPSKKILTIADIGSSLVNQNIVKHSTVECPIDTIIIPGVTLFTEKDKYHVDVLDNITCLKNTNIPHGLMSLKLRLLSRLRYRQILINGDIFESDPENARSIIEKQILNYIQYGKASSLHASIVQKQKCK